MPEQRPRCPVGAREPLAALADRADDRGAQPLAQRRRDGALQPRPGLEHARQRLVLALDRGRCASLASTAASSPASAARRSDAFCASARALSCIWPPVAARRRSPPRRAPAGSRRAFAASPALLGLLRPRGAAARPPRRRPRRASRARPRAPRSEPQPPASSGLLLQRIQPELALAEGAAQIPLGEIERLRPRPNPLGRRPRFGEPLAVAAASLLTGRDPLLDRGPPRPHLLEALLDRVPGGADLGELGLGGRQLLLLGAQVVGDDLGAQLVGLAHAASRCARPPRPGASAGAGGSEPPARRRCARSRLSRVRSSLSWALWRRLRCLPSPAASSISRRRSLGFELTISSTLPWLITEWASRPMFVSESASRTSARRQRAPFSRYSPVAVALDPP